MEMAVASIAAQPAAMHCKICRRPAQRGAKLCAQCTAAVRRARQVSTIVSDLLPASTAPASPVPGDRHSRSPPASTTRRIGLPPFSREWWPYVAFVAFGIAVCTTGFFAIEEIDSRLGPEPIPISAPTPSGEVAITAGTPVAPSMEMVAGTSVDSAPAEVESMPQEAEDAPQIANDRPQREGTQPSPARSGRLSSRHAARNPRTAAERVSTSAPTIRIASSGSESAPIPADRPPGPSQAVQPASSPESVVSDRRQLLQAAVAGCAKENLLAGFVCDQRARLQYCDGHWGEAPECPGGNRVDSGR